MAAGEGNHILLRIDGEILHLFGEIPQADDIRLPRQHFFLHVEEHGGERLPGKAAAAKTNKVIAAENIEHRRAVIHGITFDGQRILLGLIAAQDEKQVAAILLIQIIPGAVFHRQVIG